MSESGSGDMSTKKTVDRRDVESELRIRARQQAMVAALGHVALTTDDIQHLMEDAAVKVSEALPADLVEILELDDDRGSLLLRAGIGWRSGAIGVLRKKTGPVGQAGLALTAQEPIVSSDLGKETRFSPPRELLEHGARSGITVVIPGGAAPFGVLGAYAKQPREFSTDDVNLLRAVANVLAAAIKYRRSEQALSDAAARVRAIVTTLVDGIITIDDRGIMDSANPAAERLFGYTAEELVGRNVSILMPQPYRREHDGYIDNYLRTGIAKIIGIGREVLGQRKDGTVFPMELAVSEMEVAGKRMFTGVVRDVTERRRLEREILDAAADEQRRIGQDLHDGLCQELTGIAFAIEVLSQKLGTRGAPETLSIQKIAELVDQSITHARNLARGLQPVALESGGLSAALEALAAKVENLFHISCLFVSNNDCPVANNAVATHLYRIAQEAISNAVRHGKAKTVIIDCTGGSEGLRLTIRDDGIGLSNVNSDSKGMGLHTMSYRARLVGGNLTIAPDKRGGTVITCIVPPAALGPEHSERLEHGQEQQ